VETFAIARVHRAQHLLCTCSGRSPSRSARSSSSRLSAAATRSSASMSLMRSARTASLSSMSTSPSTSGRRGPHDVALCRRQRLEQRGDLRRVHRIDQTVYLAARALAERFAQRFEAGRLVQVQVVAHGAGTLRRRSRRCDTAAAGEMDAAVSVAGRWGAGVSSDSWSRALRELRPRTPESSASPCAAGPSATRPAVVADRLWPPRSCAGAAALDKESDETPAPPPAAMTVCASRAADRSIHWLQRNSRGNDATRALCLAVGFPVLVERRSAGVGSRRHDHDEPRVARRLETDGAGERRKSRGPPGFFEARKTRTETRLPSHSRRTETAEVTRAACSSGRGAGSARGHTAIEVLREPLGEEHRAVLAARAATATVR